MAKRIETPETADTSFAAGTNYFEQAQTQMMQIFSGFGDFAKGNIDALNVATTAATKGLEVLGQAASSYTRDAASAAQDSFAALRGVKTPKEFFELNQSRSKAQYDHFVAETAKMTELLMKVTGEITQPLSSRYAVAMDQMTKTAR
jgi:hypothetical protein